MEELDKTIKKTTEALGKLAESIGELANQIVKRLANALFPIPKSNNWRKLHGLPMRRRRKQCGRRKIHTWNTP